MIQKSPQNFQKILGFLLCFESVEIVVKGAELYQHFLDPLGKGRGKEGAEKEKMRNQTDSAKEMDLGMELSTIIQRT